MSGTVLHPPLKWAQRKSSLYFTIAVSDLKVDTLELTEKKLVFKGTSEETGKTQSYALEFDFFAEVDPKAEGSVWNVRPREAHFHIMKKDQEAEYWPRLTSDKAAEKKQPISVDWSRYTDEDEEDESSGFDTNAMGGGMNFADMMGGGAAGGMGGMGGMPGMGGAGGMPGMGGMGGMPGMGGMGGMPGMGGAGGAGGMDLAALMAQMGGAGGAGGMPDLSALGGAGLGDEGDSDDEADLPDLEGAGGPGADSPADGAQASGGN